MNQKKGALHVPQLQKLLCLEFLSLFIVLGRLYIYMINIYIYIYELYIYHIYYTLYICTVLTKVKNISSDT